MATPTSLPATFVAGNVLTAAQMNDLRGAFRILQVVSTTKTDTFSASLTAGTITDVTGLSVSITPSATSSKILVICQMGKGTYGALVLKRDSTEIAIGTSVSNRNAVSANSLGTNGDNATFVGAHILDAPATTSAITYQAAIHQSINGTATIYCNRSDFDTDSLVSMRTVSTITAMEISA